MSTGVYNFTIEQGAHFGRTFQWKDDAGQPVDLTGWSAAMHLRAVQPSLAVHDWTPYLTIDGPLGAVVVSVPATDADLLLLTVRRAAGVYDLELTPPSGPAERVRFLQGTWTVAREVTRPPVADPPPVVVTPPALVPVAWTPVLSGDLGGSGQTYYAQWGQALKQGPRVDLWFDVYAAVTGLVLDGSWIELWGVPYPFLQSPAVFAWSLGQDYGIAGYTDLGVVAMVSNSSLRLVGRPVAGPPGHAAAVPKTALVTGQYAVVRLNGHVSYLTEAP